MQRTDLDTNDGEMESGEGGGTKIKEITNILGARSFMSTIDVSKNFIQEE